MESLEQVFDRNLKIDTLSEDDFPLNDGTIDVEMVPDEDPYPFEDGDDKIADVSTHSAASGFDPTSDEEIEFARGFLTEDTISFAFQDDVYMVNEEVLVHESEKKASASPSLCDQQLYRMLDKWRSDPAIIKRVANTKIHATDSPNGDGISNAAQMALIRHCMTLVDCRPKGTTLISKSLRMHDFDDIIKMSFPLVVPEDAAAPRSRTLFRIYTKNSFSRLKHLVRQILRSTSQMPGIEVEYCDVLGEIRGSTIKKRIRLSTPDLKAFMDVEEQARSLSMNILTTFNLQQKDNPFFDVSIRWYDLVKSNGTRAQYIHYDHGVYPLGRLAFGTVTHSDFDIDATDLIPTSSAHPPVHDLITFVEEAAIGQSSI